MKRNPKFIPVVTCLECGAAVWMLCIAAADASTLAEDHFLTGSPPTPANGQYGVSGLALQNPIVTGMSTSWSFTTNWAVQATSLNYLPPTYPAETGGAAVAAGFSNGRDFRSFDSTPFTGSAVGNVYASFLLSMTGGGNNYRAFELYSGGFLDANQVFQVGVSSAGDFPSPAAYGFRVNANNALRGSLGAVDGSTTVHLFVLKFSLSATAGGDSVTVWEDPNLLLGPDPSGGVTASGFDFVADRISIASLSPSSNNGMGFDELRMGTTWNDAVPVPEPSSLALLAMAVTASAGRRHRHHQTANR
jgi:hypothetical protein